MTVSERPFRSNLQRKSATKGAARSLQGLAALIEFIAAAKLSDHELLSTSSPQIGLVGAGKNRKEVPAGLAYLRNALDGDWEPYLTWLEPVIRGGSWEERTFQVWNQALSAVRTRVLALVNSRKLEPKAAELIMLGLEELLLRVSELVWDVCSTGAASQVEVNQELLRQQEIDARTEDLRRSNQELEQFAYVASHDLQEPLRTVVNFAELFSERYGANLDERGERYLHHIVEGSKRMQALVRALLTYSRVSSQGKGLVAVDSQAVLKAVCDSLRATIQASGAEITWGEMPRVLADDVQLAQIFLNLIGNAIKFCDRRPQVGISARREADTWVFAVQDNGIGIEPEHAGRLFQMFQRLQPRGQYEGSGIGLALTKRITERHGGRIWFESEPDKGSIFYFALKAAETEKTDD
jgi:signal transduction histidine kinase